MGRWTLALILTALISLERSSPAAEATVNIVVTSKPCVDDWRPFIEQLRVELSDANTRVMTHGAPSDARLLLDADACGQTATHARLSFNRGDTEHIRDVDLNTVAPDSKARVLALAAGELIRSTPMDPAPVTAKDESTLHVIVDTRVEAKSPNGRVPEPATAGPLFTIAPEMTLVPETASGLLGPRIGLSFPAGPLTISLDARAVFGLSHTSLGDVHSAMTGGSFGLAKIEGPAWLRVGLGLRLELDYLRFEGTPSGRAQSSVRESPGLISWLTATSFIRYSARVWGLVGMDAGETLVGYRASAGSTVAAGLSGPVVAVRLGLAFGAGP